MCTKILKIQIFTLFLNGCLSGPKVESSWAELDDVENIDCREFPLKDNEIAVTHLSHSDKSQPKLVFTIRNNRDALEHYYYDFEGDAEIDREKVQPILLNANQVIIGSAEYAGKSVVLVYDSRVKSSEIEIRSVPENIVQAKIPWDGAIINHPNITIFGERLLIGYERQNHNIKFVSDLSKNPKFKIIGNAVYDNRFELLANVDGEKQMLLGWGPTTSLEDKNSFSLRTIDHRGVVTKPIAIALGELGEVESWHGARDLQDLYVGLVEGDSLIGQATIRAAYVALAEGEAKPIWNKTLAIKDAHVANPYVFRSQKSNYLGLVQWLDGEASLFIYRLGIDGMTLHSKQGILPAGTHIQSVIHSGGELFAILRGKSEGFYNYHICELEGL